MAGDGFSAAFRNTTGVYSKMIHPLRPEFNGKYAIEV